MHKQPTNFILKPGKLVRLSNRKPWFLSIWECQLTPPKKPILNKNALDHFDTNIPLLALTSEEFYILDDTYVRGAFFLLGTKTIGIFTSHVNETIAGTIEEAGNNGINK